MSRKKPPEPKRRREGMRDMLLWLPDALAAKLAAEAELTGRSRTEHIEAVLARHVAGVCPTCGGTGRAQ